MCSRPPVTDPEAIRRHLVEQVTGSVRWRETMLFFGTEGVTRFIECGSGKVLAGLAKRAVAGSEATSIGSAEDIAGWQANPPLNACRLRDDLISLAEPRG